MNPTAISAPGRKSTKPGWLPVVAKYQIPSIAISAWQIINSFGPFLILWALMYISLRYSYWITLALSIPAAGFLMRIFVIQHDCGHTSFFKNRKLNDLMGFICGVFTMTPY